MRALLLAAETSGLSANEDRILEIGWMVEDSGQTHCVDPEDAKLSPEIVKFHSDSKLLPDLIAAKKAGELVRISQLTLPPAEVIIVWNLDFVGDFLVRAGLGNYTARAVNSKSLAALYSLKSGRVIDAPRSRVAPKLAIMRKQLQGLVG